MSFVPRPYQQEAHDRVLESFQNSQSSLLVMPTGTGKTKTAAWIASEFKGKGRILWMSHQRELIFQGQEALEKAFGEKPEVEMADSWASKSSFWGGANIIVSSYQTQNAGKNGGRMTRFDPNDIALIVDDESHHSVSPTRRKVLEYYKQNKNMRILGLTATPKRLDEKALGQVFDHVAFEYYILDAINDGWLVKPIQIPVYVGELDYSNIHATVGGDLNGRELSELVEREGPVHGMTKPIIDLCGDKKTLIFTVTVAQAEMMAEILNRNKHGSAEYVHGKTPRDLRYQLFHRYKDGDFQYLVNVGICLDSETEILTDTGWVGIDGMTFQHKVANWDDGRIWFSPPKRVVVRDRKPNERMVTLETRNRSIRVTEDHDLLYRTYLDGGRFKKAKASEVVGKACALPISGRADPFDVVPTQEPLPRKRLEWQISHNAYALRRNNGLGFAESVTVATERIIRRRQMVYKHPKELTIRECEFIGFWLGDGSKARLRSGGVEYRLYQGSKQQNLVAWIDSLLEDLGYDNIKRTHRTMREAVAPFHVWSLSRGTGFGPQERKGVYPIEPYLNKAGSSLLWGLNEQQFSAMISGFWMADGEHRDAKKPRENMWRICNTNRGLLDLLQAIACCRGFRANISDGITNTDKGHKPLWRIKISKREHHHMTKYRLQFEAEWKKERVWCVVSDSGNIITRRRGTVTVMGNCGEGWDEPGVECVVMARPTLSRAKYEQNIGRGLRPLMGVVDGPPTADERKAAIAASRKRECLVLDFVGVSGQHKLIRCEDVLGGRLDDDVVQAVAKKSEKGERQALDIVSELVQAEREIARRNREKEEAARRSGIVIGATYTVGDYIDPFNELDVTPCRVPTWHQKHMATDAQKRYLENNGLNVPEDLNFVHASQLIQKLKETPSKKQLAQLTRCGFPTNVTREQASRFMAAIVQNHWRPLRPQQKQELIAKVLGGVENAAETQATREYTYAS